MASGDITADRAEASDGQYGASFDGVDDYVEILHHASQLGANLSNGFTISAWIFPESIGETAGKILDKSEDISTANGFTFKIAAGPVITFDIASGADKSSGTIKYNVWTHCLVTITSASLVTHYMNGVQSGIPGVGGGINEIITTNAPRIGNRSGATDRTFDGIIRGVKMWNRVLTAAEIAADYAGYNSPREGLILDVPLTNDYNDHSPLAFTGTNSGTYLLNTLPNRIKADANSLNLAADTDKIIALPRRGNPVIIGANREA